MDCVCEQAADDTTVTEHDALDRVVVCQHGNNGIAAAGVRHASSSFRSMHNEALGLGACPVVDGNIMTELQEARRHARAHMPQSDETDPHENTSPLCG